MPKMEFRNGKWSWRISLVDPETGERTQPRISATTKREVRELTAKMQTEHNAGSITKAATITLAAYCERWLAAIEGSVRPSTHDRYTRVVHGHLLPSLGRVQLGKLSPLMVQDWYADLLRPSQSRPGLSPTTVNLYHGILHGALDQAVKWRLLVRNVCDAVEPPRPEQNEMSVWDAAQVRTFFATIAGTKHEALYVLAAHTGMRRGELAALRWADVNLEAGTVAVQRTMSRGAAGLVIGEPKTRKGKRQIAIGTSVIASLRRHKAEQNERRLMLGPEWIAADLVFDRGNGELLHPNIITRTFTTLSERAGLPHIRLHDLRHTAATLMLANGEHVKVVQERLGHSDIGITMNLYSHVTQDMQRDAADRMERLLGTDS